MSVKKWVMSDDWWKLSDGKWVIKNAYPNKLLSSREPRPSATSSEALGGGSVNGDSDGEGDSELLFSFSLFPLQLAFL